MSLDTSDWQSDSEADKALIGSGPLGGCDKDYRRYRTREEHDWSD